MRSLGVPSTNGDTMHVPRSLLTAILLMLTGLTIPPHNARASDTIAGWTESQFITAAAANGVPRAAAVAAWGDRDAMAQIPVTSGTHAEGSRSNAMPTLITQRSLLVTRASTTGGSGSTWASCLRYTKNLFGSVIKQLRVQTNYSYTGTTVTSWNTRVYPTTGFGWSYSGVVASNDYYSAVGSSTRAHHSSYRMGKFDGDLGGASNIWVTTTVYAPAGYACSSGGA
jgi:hypothetical protein